jgi:succinoglycan biosynthesis transport protein ExoP
MLNLAVGIFLALLGGVAVALVREQMDTRIFTPEDVQQSIGSSNVAIVPLFGSEALSRPDSLARSIPGKTLAPEVKFLLDRPNAPVSEAIHSLYTSIMLSRLDRSPQVTLVVSSFPGEGKTTVAANLAIAMAQHGRTCIVDADLRRGRVARAFGISADLGLTEVLQGDVTVEQVLKEVPNVPQLTILPAHPGNVKAGQLICSEYMREIIRHLRQRFRFVLIDSAPLLPFADGRALSTSVDGLVFVGRSGITTRQVLRRSMELLQEVQSAPILEFVLNAADLNSAPYRYHKYGYADYYGVAAK